MIASSWNTFSRNQIGKLVALVLVFAFPSIAFCQDSINEDGSASGQVGYTVAFTATVQVGSGEPTAVYRELRLVSSSGNWRRIQQHSSGKLKEKFYEVGLGILVLHNEEKKLVRLKSAAQGLGLGEGSGSMKPIRSEEILGFTADVYEITKGDVTVLLFRARELNGDVIKIVRKSPANTFTLIPTRIEAGEPDPGAIRYPNYPIVEGN